MTDTTEETVDYVAIRRLQSAYADVVNRRAWSELDDLFVDDAPVRVDTVTSAPIELKGARAVGSFIGDATDRFEFFELVVLNAVVMFGDGSDAARGRVFTCELRQDASNGHWSNAFGVYHDDYQRGGDRWRFARRRYQSLARTGRAEVFAFPHDTGFD